MKDIKSNNVEERYQAIHEIAGLSQMGASNKLLIGDIARLLIDTDKRIAYLAAFTLVNFAEQGIDISSSSEMLAEGLLHGDTKTKKEIDWALYCIASIGKAITAAANIYEIELQTKDSIRTNAAIALALHYYNSAEKKKVDDLLKRKDHTQFGVAWAATDFTIRTKEKKHLKKIAASMRPGLHDIPLHNGIAGALSWNKQQRKAVEVAIEAINELIDETDDEMKQIKLATIFTKMQTVKQSDG